jgi:hypothetical protein
LADERLEEERKQIREERMEERKAHMAELKKKTEEEMRAREAAYLEFLVPSLSFSLSLSLCVHSLVFVG